MIQPLGERLNYFSTYYTFLMKIVLLPNHEDIENYGCLYCETSSSVFLLMLFIFLLLSAPNRRQAII